MGIFSALNIGASALSAQRIRMDIISQNIANVNTTRTENGEPYRRKTILFKEAKGDAPFSSYLTEAARGKIGGGVQVTEVVEDQAPFKEMYDPGHPDADENGMVKMPNVDIITEMINMISASRAYEANVTAMNTSKGMASKALEIGR